MPDVAAVIEFGKVFGFPALVTAALLYMIWRAGRWTAREIIKPAFDRGCRHADAIEGILCSLDQRTSRIELNQPNTCRAAPALPGQAQPFAPVDFGKPAGSGSLTPIALSGKIAPA